MKQKLFAEQELKRNKEGGGLQEHIGEVDSADDESGFMLDREVCRLASETAVINVHELLEVKAEAEEVPVSTYDHFRRLGLSQFAPIFEHFGIREKCDLNDVIVGRMEAWDP